MKTAMIAMTVSILFSAPAFAADNAPQFNGAGPSFEQRKSDILKHIDERIARNQEEKSCVQAAKNHDDIKACRDKFKAEVLQQRPKPR
ncbi:MAG TPA: hypothetical protein VN642_08760 [Dongiaceae bacterium]|nr:hypothetical protein [Dongiaceae bacterium]